MKVLLVDDSKVVRVLLRKILDEMGIEVVEAADGRAALAALADRGPFHLMLVDIHMPEMDGFEFLEQVRGRPEFDTAKVMMVTSDTDMDQVSRALQAGADEYVMKPFTKESLQEKLTILGITVNQG